MYTPSKEELSQYKADSKRSLSGYRLRKHQARQAKLNKSTASKAKAISVLAATSIIPLAAQMYA